MHQTMNTQSLSQIQLTIELIDPELAGRYLGMNFKNNRSISSANIKELAREMRQDLFQISTDCIGFDVEGRLINGQHRLSAVIESSTTQPFIVARNLPCKVAQLIDVGKKRTMAQRITIGGTRMTEKQCSTIRNAIADYNENVVGTVIFAHKRYDKLVESVYLDHCEFLEHPKIAKYIEGQGSTFFNAAALRIYAEMVNLKKHKVSFKHGQTPLERACFWLELVKSGFSTEFFTDPVTDNAAIVIKNMKEKSAQDSRGSKWYSKADCRLTMSAAWNFMMGNSIRSVRPHSDDPFTNLRKLPSSNQGI